MSFERATRLAAAAVTSLLLATIVLGCSDDVLAPGPAVRPPAAPPAVDSLPRELIDTAGTYDIVIQRTVDARVPGDPARFLIAAEAQPPTNGGAWWVRTFDGIRIPQAITRDAVVYYLDLSRAFQSGDFSGSIQQISSRFTYRADLTWQESYSLDGRSYRNVLVATMDLSWSNYCGSLCALSFSKRRVVVMDPRGTILRVSGDGPVSFWVS